MKTLIALAFALHWLVLAAQAAPLSGTKSVGPTGDYASLTAAIADVQAVGNGLGGALVLELQPAYLSTVETFPLTIPALNGASATNTLTIRPASGATALAISSANTTAATVDLNGAQFVTIDGRPGGVGSNAGSGGGAASQLTIANTSTSGLALRFINEASGNTIKYTTLRGVNTSSGVVVFSTTTGANGNDNNTIDHCDIRDGASTPANGIYSSGSTGTLAQNNSGNTISNCNIFNFYSSASNCAGVFLSTGITDWTITGSSFYQTASRSVGGEIWAMYFGSGSNHTVTNNFIGGSAPGAGGTPWTTSAGSSGNFFTGIELRGNGAPNSVQGNTIQNIAWASGAGVWRGIYIFSGSANVGNLAGNVIGNGTGAGSISVTNSGSDGTTFGISGGSSASNVVIANNTIGSITTIGVPATIAASLVGIQVTAGANTISNNTVGSATTANSLNAATSSTSTTGQQVTGILSSSGTSASITGNTVANLNNNYNNISTTGQIRGIVTSAGVNTVTGNTVRNFSTTSQNSNTNTVQSVYGISATSTVAGQTVSQNTVHSLANTRTVFPVNVTGIYFEGPTTGANLIARNLVHSLAASSTSATLNGMHFGVGTFNAQNNMVRVGFKADGTSTAGAFVRGIFDDHDTSTTAGRNFYHNSVYLGGTQASGNNTTFALLAVNGVNTARTYQNNIFVNARSNSGATTKHYAVLYNSASIIALTAGGNIFYAPNTASGGVLGRYNNADITTLAAWQAATGRDATSLNVDPLYVNPSGTAVTLDLHVSTGSPAIIAGVPLASVTDDIDGQIRALIAPTVGADEIPAPNIAVTQSAALTDGAGSVDFSTVTLGSGSAKTFTITNPGTADLASLAITKDGANASDFTVSAPSGTTVPVGSGTVTFTVTFTPGVSGARSAAIHIVSNVAGAKNPFDIALSGTGQTVFAAWAAGNGVANDPNAPGANGHKNVVNFAFDMNPAGVARPLVFNGTLAAGGTIGAVGLPTTRVEAIANGVDFRALFVRRKDAAAAGLTYTPQFSADLTTWQNAATPTVLADDGTDQIVSVPFPVLMVAGGMGFFHVSVSLAP